MGWESSDVVRFDLSPSFKVKRGQPNLKVLITRLLLILEVCNVKPTYRKSWVGNLLMWSHLTLDPFFQGQMRTAKLKSAFYLLIVSTGGIRWILWFSIRYAAAAARIEIFGVNALKGKLHQLVSPNLQHIFIGDKLL